MGLINTKFSLFNEDIRVAVSTDKVLMENIIQINYEHNAKHASDISEHMPTLKRYADECKHITEFGVLHVASTWAFLVPDLGQRR